MTTNRQQFQAVRLLELLEQADRSRGDRKPVLVMGRDGITMRGHPHSLFEVASTATVSVLDRSGQRLGSVFLAVVPESGQGRMSQQLTGLVNALFCGWEGPLPRLAYVTDAGGNETTYFQEVLRPMIHPRTGEHLEWRRVVDFYHAMTRVWAMAACLFKETREAHSWARKMGRLLKQANGPFRVLHSAAALASKRGLRSSKKAEYDQACNYLRQRTQWMQYHVCQKNHLPIGSGITEAACKTIYTQRLKLSGMRWTKAGAQVILDLRVLLLSGVWDKVYRQTLNGYAQTKMRTPGQKADVSRELAV
jgi:hypothetical protein